MLKSFVSLHVHRNRKYVFGQENPYSRNVPLKKNLRAFLWIGPGVFPKQIRGYQFLGVDVTGKEEDKAAAALAIPENVPGASAEYILYPARQQFSGNASFRLFEINLEFYTGDEEFTRILLHRRKQIPEQTGLDDLADLSQC